VKLIVKQLKYYSSSAGTVIARYLPSNDATTLVDGRGFKALRVLKKSYFKVKSDLKALEQVLFSFDQLNQPWIPKEDWLQCQLALAEGFTNAVRHAHKNFPPEIPIEVEIKLSGRSLEMRIWDYGPPFDLAGFFKNMTEQDDRLSSDHGQGIPILYKIAAHLSYRRTDDNRNCLLIIKHFSLDSDE
jgi:serine/threonine-protein kinase RsbW